MYVRPLVSPPNTVVYRCTTLSQRGCVHDGWGQSAAQVHIPASGHCRPILRRLSCGIAGKYMYPGHCTDTRGLTSLPHGMPPSP